MTKHFFLPLFFIFFSLNANAQIFQEYPKGQYAYQKKHLYKDLHEILMKNFNPCDNKNELIWLKVLINEKGDAKFIENNTENKCANDLAKGVIKYLNKWIPAKLNNSNANAVANFIFYPDDLFENYKKDYSPLTNYIESQFPEGINAFRQQLMQSVIIPDSKKGVLRFIVMFEVDKFGVINDIEIETSEKNTEKFQKNIKNAIEILPTKWIPAKYKGLAINSRFRMPVTIQFD